MGYVTEEVDKMTQRKNINLNMNIEEEGFLEISLLDPSGDLVYNYSNFIKEGNYTHQISCNNLKSKQYLLRIAKNGSSEMKKILIK